MVQVYRDRLSQLVTKYRSRYKYRKSEEIGAERRDRGNEEGYIGASGGSGLCNCGLGGEPRYDVLSSSSKAMERTH